MWLRANVLIAFMTLQPFVLGCDKSQVHWNHVPVLAQIHKGHRGNVCPGSPSSNTNIIYSYHFFLNNDKSHSNKYSLPTLNRKLFCTLSKAFNLKIINWLYYKQTVLIPLNCGQELNDLKILSNLWFWLHFQHNNEGKPTTSVWYLQWLCNMDLALFAVYKIFSTLCKSHHIQGNGTSPKQFPPPL